MTVLVIPKKRSDKDGTRIALSFLPPILGGKHESLCGENGELIRWADFHMLRLRRYAWIETNDLERVCAARGVSVGTAGIIEPK